MGFIFWFVIIFSICVIASGIFGLVKPPKTTEVQATVMTVSGENYTVSYKVNNISYTSKLQSNNKYTVNQVITVYYNANDMSTVVDNPSDMKYAAYGLITCGIISIVIAYYISKFTNSD